MQVDKLKKCMTTILLTALIFTIFFLENDAFAETIREFGLNLDTGYRVDNLDWNIAGDITGNNPNILSELTWSDLKIYQVKVGGKIIVDRLPATFSFYSRGSLSYGWVYDGSNQDSDYLGDNRTLEFSRSNNSADDGNTLDISLGIGLQFRTKSERFEFASLVGYSHSEQNLTITDGFQTISRQYLIPGIELPPIGPFPGLNSTYEAEWKGPWIGIDLSFEVSKSFTLASTIEYHWATYYAEADWNLRTDLAHPKSFEHDAKGNGVVVSAGGNYIVNNQWIINAEFGFQQWSTGIGTDKTFFSSDITAETQLNEVNWDSYAIILGVKYRFK